MTPEQVEALRAYVTALGDPASGLSEPYGRMRSAIGGGWPAVARLLLAQHDKIERAFEDHDTIASLRAENERLRAGIDRAIQFEKVREVARARAGCVSCCCHGADMTRHLHALAREDGEE